MKMKKVMALPRRYKRHTHNPVSNSGSSGTGSSTILYNPADSTDTQVPPVTDGGVTDLSLAPWAKEANENLADKGFMTALRWQMDFFIRA